MQKQQAQETMRVIEKNISTEKKQKLELLLDEIVDTYFALEVGKDNCVPLIELSLKYWTTYFGLDGTTIVYEQKHSHTTATAEFLKNKIWFSPLFQEKLSNLNSHILPTIFGLVAHECTHIVDFFLKQSHTYCEKHRTNPDPNQTLVKQLKNRLLEYRQTKYPSSLSYFEIEIHAEMIYLNMHSERYAREFETKANNMFQGAVNIKANQPKFQEKIELCNKTLNSNYENKQHDEKLINTYLSNPKSSFSVLYNELLEELPQKVQEFVYLENNNQNAEKCRDFCAEVLNMQALPEFYNQEIIDTVKPQIQSLHSSNGEFVQAILLGVDKKTTKKDLDQYISHLAYTNKKLFPIVVEYFDREYVESTYQTALKNKNPEK